jgi:hypothetical protein
VDTPGGTPGNPHFELFDSWEAAEERVGYAPLVPVSSHELERLALFVRDHRMREVPPKMQALEAYYGSFVFSQSRPGEEEARRRAIDERYGDDPRTVSVEGREGRGYERGPEPPPDDPDPRMPAVVAWADGPRSLLLASDQLELADLLTIAASLY